MPPPRIVALVLVPLVWAGIGVLVATRGSGETTLLRPPLRVVNRPAPADVEARLAYTPPPLRSAPVCLKTIEVTYGGVATPIAPSPPREPPCEIEEESVLVEGSPEAETALARGARARVIAELPLRRGGRALFVVYRSMLGATCNATFTVTEGEVEGAPDICGSDCADICLGSDWAGGPTQLLAGTVPRRADVLRLGFPGGRTLRVSLTGPAVPGDETRRAVLLELDEPDAPETIAALRGEATVAWEGPAYAEPMPFGWTAYPTDP